MLFFRPTIIKAFDIQKNVTFRLQMTKSKYVSVKARNQVGIFFDNEENKSRWN